MLQGLPQINNYKTVFQWQVNFANLWKSLEF